MGYVCLLRSPDLLDEGPSLLNHIVRDGYVAFVLSTLTCSPTLIERRSVPVIFGKLAPLFFCPIFPTSYSMRVSRAPSANEGKTALHIAAETGKKDLVRYLLQKGARIDIADAGGHKPIDLLNPANAAEIREMLENSKKVTR